MSISPRRCRKKKRRLEWLHPQRLNLRHVENHHYVEQKTYVKITTFLTWMTKFLDESKILNGKPWNYQNHRGPTNMSSEVYEKTSTALTLFFFCDPSKVLSSFWASELTFGEVNYQRDVGTEHIHLQRSKTRKTEMLIFLKFWDPSGPTLAIGRRFGRATVERNENHTFFQKKVRRHNELSLGPVKVLKKEGESSLFRMPFTF